MDEDKPKAADAAPPKVISLSTREAHKPEDSVPKEEAKVVFPLEADFMANIHSRPTTVLALVMDEDGNVGSYVSTIRPHVNEVLALLALYKHHAIDGLLYDND